MKTYSRSQVNKYKKEALAKIITILDKGDVEEQFEKNSGAYHSSEKFIITYLGNYKGMMVEFGLDKTDSFYASYSGYKCIYAARNLFFEKQLKGFDTIEHGLIYLGMKLCSAKKKEEFFDRYAVPYNKRVQTNNQNKSDEKNKKQ